MSINMFISALLLAQSNSKFDFSLFQVSNSRFKARNLSENDLTNMLKHVFVLKALTLADFEKR